MNETNKIQVFFDLTNNRKKSTVTVVISNLKSGKIKQTKLRKHKWRNKILLRLPVSTVQIEGRYRSRIMVCSFPDQINFILSFSYLVP